MLSLVIAAALLVHPATQADGPFSALTYEAALEQAKTAKKLLLVDFTASWCQPCKKMEKETWAEAGVRAWLKEHAIAIQIDVDEQKELAQRFEIEAMPTVVALRDGKEFDRIVGYRDAARFLAWTGDVLAGKRTSDELEVRVKRLKDSEDVDARYKLAQDLVRAKRYEEALEHYLWLWPATRKVPAMYGVRLSFMLAVMADLAKKHAPAKRAFGEILEGLQAKIDAAPVPELLDWQEWSALCKYFGESARILTWYEKRRDDQGRLFAGNPVGPVPERIVNKIFDTLMESKRPVDAARLWADAKKRAEKMVADYRKRLATDTGQPEEVRKSVEDYGRQKLTWEMSMFYAGLLGAQREQEADEVAALLLQTLDLPESRLALVDAGLDATERRPESFGRWLDEAEKAGGDVSSLRERLAETLEDSPAPK